MAVPPSGLFQHSLPAPSSVVFFIWSVEAYKKKEKGEEKESRRRRNEEGAGRRLSQGKAFTVLVSVLTNESAADRWPPFPSPPCMHVFAL